MTGRSLQSVAWARDRPVFIVFVSALPCWAFASTHAALQENVHCSGIELEPASVAITQKTNRVLDAPTRTLLQCGIGHCARRTVELLIGILQHVFDRRAIIFILHHKAAIDNEWSLL